MKELISILPVLSSYMVIIVGCLYGLSTGLSMVYKKQITKEKYITTTSVILLVGFVGLLISSELK